MTTAERQREFLRAIVLIMLGLALLLAPAKVHAQNTRRTEGVIYMRTAAPTAADADLKIGDIWVDTNSGPPVVAYILDDLTPTWTAIGAGGGGAPTNATYIVQTADATLTNEQALAALGTGLMKNTTVTGVISIYAGAACTNQVIEDLSAAGAPTCATITSAYTSGTFPASGHNLLSATHSDTVAQSGTKGDLITWDESVVRWTVLPGNNTLTKKFLTQTGDSFFSAIPVWDTIVAGDVPTLNQNTTGQAGTGDSATAFFGAGTLEVARGGTGSAPASDDQALISDSSAAATWRTIANCTDTGGNHLNYTAATNSFSCGTSSGGGSAHNLLSATHSDTTTDTVAAGDLIYGDTTPKWKRLAKGTAGQMIQMIASGGPGTEMPTWFTPTYGPDNADYWVGTSTGNLSAEKSLGALATGLVLNTVAAGTGTPSQYAGTTCTNQFVRSLNNSGAATCATVGATDLAATQSRTTLTASATVSDATIATYTTITGLSFTPLANTNYIIECYIIYTSTAATTGISLAWDTPAGITSIHATGYTTTTATGGTESIIQRADNVASTTANSIITVENLMRFDARLRNGATSATMSLGITPETANSVSALINSTCQYWTY